MSDQSTPRAHRDREGAPTFTLVSVLAVLARHAPWFAYITVTFGGATAVVSLILPPKYVGRVVVAYGAESKDLGVAGGLGAVAGQLGIALPGSEASPQFVAQLVDSRSVRAEVLRDTLHGLGSTVQLLDALGVDAGDSSGRFEEGLDLLREMTGTRVDRESGLVTIEVLASDPGLAADIANAYVGALTHFNVERRQSQAREERRFVNGLLQDMRDSLQEAEDALRGFLERNRTFEQSPQLTFEYDRRRRRVDALNELVSSLRRSYETARINEVRDTPVLTIIDRAMPANERAAPRVKRNIAAAVVIGTLIAMLWVFTLEYVLQVKRHAPDEWLRLREALQVKRFGRRTKNRSE